MQILPTIYKLSAKIPQFSPQSCKKAVAINILAGLLLPEAFRSETQGKIRRFTIIAVSAGFFYAAMPALKGYDRGAAVAAGALLNWSLSR